MPLSKLILPAFIFLSPEVLHAQSPVANFTANLTAVCSGSTVIFTNTSTGNIATYAWNFGAGANPSTANTAGPHNVIYSTTGTKTITLTVTGPNGSSTLTRTNFITVGFERIKVMTYNLLNYPDNSGATADSTARHPLFRTVVAAAIPDILVVDEMNSQTGMNWFLSSIMNTVSTGYAAGTFINGFDTDNGIFYKSSKFSFVANKRIITDLRDINEFKLVHTLTGDTLRIYSVHLKSSTGSSEEAQRAQEVDSLRKVTNALPAGSNFIVCGDFNIYKSSESAYQKLMLVNPANEGHFIDPLPLTGTWNDPSFSIYHTQSTRTRSFNNGANGGLNDRFDMILFSKAVNLAGGVSYVANSTTPLGNDGNHYNDSINQPPNNAVSQSVANALHYASDHLPVYANFDFELTNCQQPDIGVQALTSPADSLCPDASVPLQVSIKNYGAISIHFSSSNANVVLHVTNPNSVIQTFSKNITSGLLSPGNTMLINFDSTYNMNAAGNYSFTANTSISNDGNAANDAMPATAITIIQNTAAINPSGSVMICQGDSIILNASAGTDYTWSTGATTASIVVSDTGNFSVIITHQNGCTATSDAVHVSYKYFSVSGNVFTETMGSVTSTTAIATHENNNGFDNDNLRMSGTADIRNTLNSFGYATASGGANVFITSIAGRNFIISGMNTSGMSNLVLSFGIHKNTTASTGADFLVEASTDGINYDSLPFAPFSNGAGWYYKSVTGIPSTQNLRILFKQNGTVTQYRIDDVLLTYSNDEPAITANGATTFCKTDSVILTASVAPSYLWNTGATTQNIVADTTGDYSVKETSANGCTANSMAVPVTSNYCSFTIEAKIFIEGLYSGNGMMRAVIDPATYPLLCDTLEMSLAQPIAPYAILYSDKKVISTNENASFNFNTLPVYNSYYVVIRHRNSMETWSASPVFVNDISTAFDFTTSTPNFNRNKKPFHFSFSRL